MTGVRGGPSSKAIEKDAAANDSRLQSAPHPAQTTDPAMHPREILPLKGSTKQQDSCDQPQGEVFGNGRLVKPKVSLSHLNPLGCAFGLLREDYRQNVCPLLKYQLEIVERFVVLVPLLLRSRTRTNMFKCAVSEQTGGNNPTTHLKKARVIRQVFKIHPFLAGISSKVFTIYGKHAKLPAEYSKRWSSSNDFRLQGFSGQSGKAVWLEHICRSQLSYWRRFHPGIEPFQPV